MCKSVITYLKSILEFPLQDRNILFGIDPYCKKCCRDFFPFKNIQDLRSPLFTGAIIKSKNQLMTASFYGILCEFSYYISRRKLYIILFSNQLFCAINF